jgi:hypothetical protein
VTRVIFAGTGRAAFSLSSLSAAAMLSSTLAIIKVAARAAAALASLTTFSEALIAAISAGEHFLFVWSGTPGCLSALLALVVNLMDGLGIFSDDCGEQKGEKKDCFLNNQSPQLNTIPNTALALHGT